MREQQPDVTICEKVDEVSNRVGSLTENDENASINTDPNQNRVLEESIDDVIHTYPFLSCASKCGRSPQLEK